MKLQARLLVLGFLIIWTLPGSVAGLTLESISLEAKVDTAAGLLDAHAQLTFATGETETRAGFYLNPACVVTRTRLDEDPPVPAAPGLHRAPRLENHHD